MSVNLRRQTKTCLFWARFKTQRLPPGRWSACNQALDAVWHIWACFADHTCVSKKPQSGKRVPSGVKIPNVNTDLWPFLSFLSIIYIYMWPKSTHSVIISCERSGSKDTQPGFLEQCHACWHIHKSLQFHTNIGCNHAIEDLMHHEGPWDHWSKDHSLYTLWWLVWK